MKDSIKVFLSIAFGSFVGSFISLEWLSVNFFWIGTIVGGFVGYLSYKITDLVEAVPKAWNRARGYSLDKETLKLSAKFGLIKSSEFALIIFNSLFIFIVSFIALTVMVEYGYAVNTDSAGFIIHIIVLIAFISGILFPLFFITSILSFFGNFYNKMKFIESVENREKIMKKTSRKIRNDYSDFKRDFKELNGFKVLFIKIPFGLNKFIKSIVLFLPDIVRFLFKFIKNLLLQIHSEIRILCGIYAAIGAAVGFFSGSALFGALFGAVFGILNYEVVSKRLLGVVPNGNG